MAIRLLMCGSRDWTDKKAIAYCLHQMEVEYGGVTTVIEGEAPGADTLSREAAMYRGIPVERYPADWKRYGKGAGPIRNLQMLREGKPDVVIAFHEDIGSGRGTLNMVERALN